MRSWLWSIVLVGCGAASEAPPGQPAAAGAAEGMGAAGMLAAPVPAGSGGDAAPEAGSMAVAGAGGAEPPMQAGSAASPVAGAGGAGQSSMGGAGGAGGGGAGAGGSPVAGAGGAPVGGAGDGGSSGAGGAGGTAGESGEIDNACMVPGWNTYRCSEMHLFPMYTMRWNEPDGLTSHNGCSEDGPRCPTGARCRVFGGPEPMEGTCL